MIQPSTDSDEIDFDGDQIPEIEPTEPEQLQRRIFTRLSDPTVKDLYDRYKDGELALQPDFQRYSVWDRSKASRLIESVVLDVPLPIIYLAEEKDGRDSAIDGTALEECSREQ